MTYKVHINYSHVRIDGKGLTFQSSITIDVSGKTESAIMEKLRKMHPGENCVIKSIEWRN
jgi:hypothetical protein